MTPYPVADCQAGKTCVRWFVGLGTGTNVQQIATQEEVVKDFNASQDKVQLILEIIPNNSGTNDILSTEFASGNGPDIIGPVGWAGSNAFKGQWLDIGPLIKSSGFDTAIFDPALIKFYQTEEGQVGLPFAVFPGGMYYIPSMFDEAGLAYPPSKYGDKYTLDGKQVDWNYDTMTEVAKRLTVDVNGKDASQDGFDATKIVQAGYAPQFQSIQSVGTFYGGAQQIYSGDAIGNFKSDIPVYGPDISQFIGNPVSAPAEGDALDYLREFLKVNGDMVDIVTVHRYPFPTCQNCGNPTWAQLRDNTSEWDNTLPNLRRIIKATVGKDLPVGVTEYNSNYSHAAGQETSPDSFYNALWLADIYGRLVRQRPEVLAYWLLKFNDGGAGLLTSFDVRPSYYSFVMWKKFGNHLLAANTDIQYVSVYAAKRDDGSVTVMLINLNDTEIKKPLQFNNGAQLTLTEAYLFDPTHNAETLTPPAFQNGAEIVLPKESVTLYIFKEK